MNNYARMSFNFGPTLLSWLADKAPRAYRMILDADKFSAHRYSGHGSAIAQVYNHIIMPLASERDALTQIRWGIADFEHRFGRRPEGMWLAETAVNRSVLDLMAREGIKFTILAPNQCARVRRMTPAPASTASTGLANAAGELAARTPPANPNGSASSAADPVQEWIGTLDATVDPTHPYLVKLDAGRSIAVFFYNGPASRAIAFEGLLNSGEDFGRRPPGRLSLRRLGRTREGPTLPRRHRRRKLRPPPQTWGDGALLRRALDRRRRPRPLHQLWRVPGQVPAHMGGRSSREYLLELRPRR